MMAPGYYSPKMSLWAKRNQKHQVSRETESIYLNFSQLTHYFRFYFNPLLADYRHMITCLLWELPGIEHILRSLREADLRRDPTSPGCWR